jgi:type III secretion system FlhB-like substrate exporter
LTLKDNCATVLHYKTIELEPYDKKLERICILIVSRKELYVALEYKTKNDVAPKLVLKGTNFDNIISDCKQHSIVVKYNKKMAENIFNNIKIGQEIPAETYKDIRLVREPGWFSNKSCKMPCILLFSAEFVRKLKFPNNSIIRLFMECSKVNKDFLKKIGVSE